MKKERSFDRKEMRNIDSDIHLRGESLYLDDIPLREGTLHAVICGSPVGHGKIKGIDLSEALKMPGVHKILTHKDVLGNNEIGTIIADQPLFAEDKVTYQGMPVALVLAESWLQARHASQAIKLDIEELDAIVDPRVAQEKGELLVPTRSFILGDADGMFEHCAHVIEGRADIDGQEHLYLETQAAYACPQESGDMKIYASSQAPAHVQEAVHKATGLPIHKIEIETLRLGGAFGGKEVQSDTFSSLVALGAIKTKRPVKLVLDRHTDLIMSGKRHPYSFDYKIGFDKDHKILGYAVEVWQNGGAFADISPAVLERTLFHGCASYAVHNAKIVVHSCRTNLPPHTAFRGFGAPQSMFAFESAMYKASIELGVDREELQKKNLLKEGGMFPYGQVVENCNALKCWEQAEQKFNLAKMKKDAEEFNKKNPTMKKGVAVFPLCFGISFTTTFLNQGRSLVHIYMDGTVGVSTGVIEMGQGVNTKIIQVASETLSISPERIKIIPTNTTRIANASPTAASSGADLNGKATELACKNLTARLKKVAGTVLGKDSEKIIIKDEVVYYNGEATELEWDELIVKAFMNMVAISEHAHYAAPKIYFDKQREKGRAFAYHVYGTAIIETTVDCLRGTYNIDSAKIVHDFGNTMNGHIDYGQVEGALMQGIGLVTNEELLWNDKGILVSDSLSSYKVPDINFAPDTVEIDALDTEPAEHAIFGSKAVGEPPLMYGLGTFFSIHNAMRAFNPNYELELHSPVTHQKCMEKLYQNFKG